MSFTLADKIFSYFGVNAKVTDTYQRIVSTFPPTFSHTFTGGRKGIWERFNISLGKGYDQELQQLVDDFQDNTIVPQLMLSKLIPHMESMLGNPVVISDQVAMRRKIIQFAQQLYDVKSTRLSYQMLFNLLGFDSSVTIEELTITSGFDSSITLDDPIRTFDMGSKPCSDYNIYLTGTITLTAEIRQAIRRIIEFLEPINAHLRTVFYNGVAISFLGTFDSSFSSSFA